jgi:hypothetical protein
VVAVEQQVDLITAVAVDMAVDIVGFVLVTRAGSVPAMTGLSPGCGRKP